MSDEDNITLSISNLPVDDLTISDTTVPLTLDQGWDPIKDIKDFHEKYGLEYDGKPRQLEIDLNNFRCQFLREELKEYVDSSLEGQACVRNEEYGEISKALEGQLDALVDLVYVALGTAYLSGFDFREAWNRVHRANMSKVRAQSAGDSKRGSTFDVVKPEGWVAPDHSNLVEDHAHVDG